MKLKASQHHQGKKPQETSPKKLHHRITKNGRISYGVKGINITAPASHSNSKTEAG